MGIIKTPLRNCLQSGTLSALMMCSLNGPELGDKEAVHALILRASAKWVVMKARTPARASGAARPKTIYKGKSIGDTSADPIRVLRGALDGAVDDVEDDVAMPDDIAGCSIAIENEENDPAADEPECAWCEETFQAPEGWRIVLQPPERVITHSTLKRAAKIAHRFKDAWHLGVFRYISQTGSEKGMKATYYNDEGLLYFHSLDLDDYGIDKKWVILKRAPKKKPVADEAE
ncbi:hypothetical protein CYMTET_10941 [Cymbomonas tetramitiformis]|uniref:Uncharacterized protein n=1 Tax=Cymbomonas tetramitiformis TaxID=36881 RepID=A0AAE0GNQ5_9CHLO|nr:hypothetical protein CYMTET_10941 [Cymbomonas tetramitiformis]